MSDDRNRLVACRACGNRVAREARRCPACGTRGPTAAASDAPASRPGATTPLTPSPPVAGNPSEAPAEHTARVAPVPRAPRSSRPEGAVFAPPRPRADAATPRPPRRAARRRRRALLAGLVLVLALTAASVAVVYVNTPPLAPRSSQPERAPAPVAAVTPPAVPVAAAPSRSRGHSDWLFFFKPGDWLARMADDALLGVVVRLEKTHTFTDGSTGPAYAVQSMEGEERVVDADELERSARLR